MDSGTVLGVAALIVSLVALSLSTTLSVVQARLLRDANHIPAVVELLSEFRKPQLHEDYQYVTQKLRREHGPQLGISGLPEPAKSAVISVAYYFQTFAFMVGFGIIDERRLFVTALRGRVLAVWNAIEPYVEAERSQQDLHVLAMLETLSQ